MRTKILSIAGWIVLGASSLTAQSPQTIRGFVSDAECGASHGAPSAAVTACVKGCFKHGSAAVLVSDGKVYKLKGNVAAVMQYPGQNVTVTGTVDGDVVTIESATPLKS
jgi:hypothetical protein